VRDPDLLKFDEFMQSAAVRLVEETKPLREAFRKPPGARRIGIISPVSIVSRKPPPTPYV
jgi:hypothetical protein